MAVIGGTEIVASFRIGSSGGVSSINGLTGVVTLAAGTNLTIVPTGNTLTFNAFGTIAGTIATGQVAFGTGANTIGGTGPSFFGSPSLFWDNTQDFLTVVTGVGADSTGIPGAIFAQNDKTPSSGIPEYGIQGTVSVTAPNTAANFFGVYGNTSVIGGPYTGIIAGVAGVADTISGVTASVLASVLAQNNMQISGGTVALNVGFYSLAQAASATLNAAFYAVDQTNGATNYAFYSAGGKNFFGGTEGTEFGGPIKLDGSSSGSATIGVAAAAGTPNEILLPTTTGSNGQVLTTNGANPQQTSWTTVGGATVIANGTAALGTTSIATLSSAAVVTVAAAGVLTTDSIIWAFNAAPGTGYSGTATSGLFVLAYVSSGNVNFLVINPTAGGIVPPAATLNWRVIR